MLKPFLVVFNNSQITRKDLLDFLDTKPEIKNWFAFMPSAIFVISDRRAFQISQFIHTRFPEVYFVVSEVPKGENDGWLSKEAWNFINNPLSSGRWPL